MHSNSNNLNQKNSLNQRKSAFECVSAKKINEKETNQQNAVKPGMFNIFDNNVLNPQVLEIKTPSFTMRDFQSNLPRKSENHQPELLKGLIKNFGTSDEIKLLPSLALGNNNTQGNSSSSNINIQSKF